MLIEGPVLNKHKCNKCKSIWVTAQRNPWCDKCYKDFLREKFPTELIKVEVVDEYIDQEECGRYFY